MTFTIFFDESRLYFSKVACPFKLSFIKYAFRLFLGLQGMDMYGANPNSGYSHMRPPVNSNAMLIPGHPHHMMMAHGGMGHHGMPSIQSAQSPPLHGGMDSMGSHIQDIHAG